MRSGTTFPPTHRSEISQPELRSRKACASRTHSAWTQRPAHGRPLSDQPNNGKPAPPATPSPVSLLPACRIQLPDPVTQPARTAAGVQGRDLAQPAAQGTGIRIDTAECRDHVMNRRRRERVRGCKLAFHLRRLEIAASPETVPGIEVEYQGSGWTEPS